MERAEMRDQSWDSPQSQCEDHSHGGDAEQEWKGKQELEKEHWAADFERQMARRPVEGMREKRWTAGEDCYGQQ